MTWTLFWDMHSGGGTKEGPYENIYIEAPRDEAKIVFYNRFKHNPDRVSCTCCGPDYTIDESESLEQLSGFHRKCQYNRDKKEYLESAGIGRYMSMSTYRKQEDVLIIPKEEIKDDERTGTAITST